MTLLDAIRPLTDRYEPWMGDAPWWNVYARAITFAYDIPYRLGRRDARREMRRQQRERERHE